MSINVVVQDGIVKSPGLRYATDGKAEYRFILEQSDGDFCTWVPCFAPGAAGRGAGGDHGRGAGVGRGAPRGRTA
jgi:hypothetical protein